MNSEQAKQVAAKAALVHIRGYDIIGVGSGSTVRHFITALEPSARRLKGAVASSADTARRLEAIGVDVIDLNEAGTLPVYVDGADEATRHGHLIKGGGGALTREKIIAAASRRFICMIHRPKLVDVLGDFGLPIEVIPMARSYVARELSARGGRPEWREGFVTDNGNHIIDIKNLRITDPPGLEAEFGQIAGVVTVGLFAHRGADVLLVADEVQAQTLIP